MKQTGEILKQAREKANLSVSEVALATKINPKILTAIENGDSAHLPAKTFLKGFVRSYALYLKMDVEDVMKVFQAETGNTPAPVINPEVIRAQNEAVAAQAPAKAESQSSKRRIGDDETFPGLRAMAVTVIVVLIGVIIGVRELIEKYQREKVVETSAEIKVSPLPPNTPPITPSPAPQTAETKTEEVKITDEKSVEAKSAEAKSTEAKPAETKPADVKPADVKATVSVTTVPATAPVPAPTAATPPAPTPAPTPAPAATPVAAAPAPAPAVPSAPDPKKEEAKKEVAESVKPQSAIKAAKTEIILEALDKVDVKFKVHGQAKIVSLAPTQVHTIFADEPMTLDFSDGGAVNIILNGRERGVPGDLGKPKQVQIP